MDKSYTIWILDFFDESIEENNTYHQTLTKEHAVLTQKNSESWISGSCSMTIEKILQYIWGKDDIDLFIEHYPENSKYTYHCYGRNKDEKYCPLQRERERKINLIL